MSGDDSGRKGIEPIWKERMGLYRMDRSWSHRCRCFPDKRKWCRCPREVIAREVMEEEVYGEPSIRRSAHNDHLGLVDIVQYEHSSQDA